MGTGLSALRRTLGCLPMTKYYYLIEHNILNSKVIWPDKHVSYMHHGGYLLEPVELPYPLRDIPRDMMIAKKEWGWTRAE